MKARKHERITEGENPASASLDTKPTTEILRIINREDRKVAPAVGKVLPQIARAVDLAAEALAQGGRLVYLGAGTSGRLGVMDAAECIPTFGTDRVVGILAGMPEAMFGPVEGAEDEPLRAVRDLRRIRLGPRDVLVGVSASGRTPYTLGGMRYARRLGAKTVALCSDPGAPMCRLADVVIVPMVGPEVIAGSTRMKAGTAQKLVLSMLSTASMVRAGRVFSNWMVNLRLSNRKLRRRAESILARATGVAAARAARTLKAADGNLPAALLMLKKNISKAEARRLLGKEHDTAAALRSEWVGQKRQARKLAARGRTSSVGD